MKYFDDTPEYVTLHELDVSEIKVLEEVMETVIERSGLRLDDERMYCIIYIDEYRNGVFYKVVNLGEVVIDKPLMWNSEYLCGYVKRGNQMFFLYLDKKDGKKIKRKDIQLTMPFYKKDYSPVYDPDFEVYEKIEDSVRLVPMEEWDEIIGLEYYLEP